MTRCLQLQLGDCVKLMQGLPENCIGAVITDPPYGLEFMGKDWDAPWRTGAGMSAPGIGDRAIPWPSFGGATPFGGANPTCSECGGRLRGANKCECEEPSWVVDGEEISDGSKRGISEALKQKHLFQQWCVGWLTECHRVLRPGGLIKIFGATRMYHRMGAAMIQAGFKVERLEAWTYGSGFPKGLDIAKALDNQAGAVREVLATRKGRVNTMSGRYNWNNPDDPVDRSVVAITEPTTDLAKKYKGYNTALKPAWEPFLVGRKPL